MENNLQRFLIAQETDYKLALSEIKNGRKRSHWIWYIFPQIQGLGFSETSKYYAIENIDEAEAFLKHPLLGSRLIAICKALIHLKENNASEVMGSPDDMKLKSSMTLFSVVDNADEVFQAVLNKFFNGEKGQATLQIISEQRK